MQQSLLVRLQNLCQLEALLAHCLTLLPDHPDPLPPLIPHCLSSTTKSKSCVSFNELWLVQSSFTKLCEDDVPVVSRIQQMVFLLCDVGAAWSNTAVRCIRNGLHIALILPAHCTIFGNELP